MIVRRVRVEIGCAVTRRPALRTHLCIWHARLEPRQPGTADPPLLPPVGGLVVDQGRQDVDLPWVHCQGRGDGKVARLQAGHDLQQPLQRHSCARKVLQRLQDGSACRTSIDLSNT